MRPEFAPNDVAVTGMGIISCLGLNVQAVTQSLRDGRSGIVVDPERVDRFRSALTGKVHGFDPKAMGLTRKMLRTMDEPARFAAVAADQAIHDAQWTDELIQSPRCGLIFGNDSTSAAAIAAHQAFEASGETHFIGAGAIFQGMNSTVTMNLAARFGIRGAAWTTAAACASGAHAIGQAVMLIRAGLQDRVIAGGAQETGWQSMTSFDALGVFSTRTDTPHAASRPFDADRDGLVPSGGAACLTLERLDLARKRGATIHGLITGYGFSCQLGQSLSQPTAEGAVDAMTAALADARLNPEDIDYINAHATSTPLGDLAEAQAIHRIFGEQVPVSSTKSMTGHECWMAGASELVYTLCMAQGRFLAPNLNFHKLDEQCPPIQVIDRTREAKITAALSNSMGFGGTNAGLIVRFDI